MKKKILASVLTIALLCALVLPALPVQADSRRDVPPGQVERLEHGWRRLDPHTKVHTIRNFTDAQGKGFAEVEAEIDSLPTTLNDCITLIDTNWYLQTDSSGQSYFQNGVNLFTSRVLGGRVSIEDEDGRLSVWDTRITIGGETFSGGNAKIVDDPINENYEGNCLLWEYGEYSSGWWFFGTSAKAERYLRVIEGRISELWLLPIDPKANVIIALNESTESDFGGHIEWLNAYDAEGIPLRVTKNRFGSYIINATEFVGKTFPVTIDPDYDFFTTSSYDGSMFGESGAYATARTMATATYISHTSNLIHVGQAYYDPTSQYTVMRLPLYFNTASVPNAAVLSAGRIQLWGMSDLSVTDFYITANSGMPTYPHIPPIASDYNYSNYSGNGGQFYTDDFTDSFINEVELSPTGLGWTNKTGWTKYLLRSSRDIAGNTPTGDEYVIVWSYEAGAPYQPRLMLVWTVPIGPPDVDTMEASNVSGLHSTLEGYLDDDGGEDCSVWYKYGTTTAYGDVTPSQSGVATGTYFDYTIDVLPGTTYHFKAFASNSDSTQEGIDRTFTTPPNTPYNFSATAGDGTVALAWTKGTGADKTMVRRGTTTYPTSPTDGTQIYFDTGASHDDNTAANGIEYFYSAWSEETGVYSTTYVSANATPSAPTVGTATTLPSTPVGVNTATGNMNIDDLGGSAHVHVQLQYYKGAGTWTDNETPLSGEEGLGPYSYDIVGLDADTLYHIRAKITNDTGTAYGSDVPFTTGANFAPTMTSQSPSSEQLTAVTLEGEVTNDGGLPCEVWFEIGLDTNYLLGPTTSEFGYTTGEQFSRGIANLEPATTYHYRIVGENDIGIAYGDDETAVTDTPTAPTTRTDIVSDIGANQAQLNQTILTDGEVECEAQFQVSDTGDFTGEEVDTGWVPGYAGGQVYSKLISGLTIGETYYVRAQVRNAGGTGTGDSVEFTTVFGAPTNFRARAISSTTINVSWTKQGDQTCVRYKIGGYPLDREDGTQIYRGSDEFTSVSGLIAGTTYYFRSWSWRTGDHWADNYAEDVATTQASLPAGEEEPPTEIFDEPVETDMYHQEPSGEAFVNIPGYEEALDVADTFETPESLMWLGATIIFALIFGAGSFGLHHNAYGSVLIGASIATGLSIAGGLPFWYVVIWVFAAIGGAVALVKLRTA